MISRTTVTMAKVCPERSYVSLAEMFQYVSAINMNKEDMFQYAHYKIKNTSLFSVVMYKFSELDGEKFLFDENITFYLLSVLG